MKYLLDTCVISELVKPQPDRKVVEWVRRQDETALFLSVVTIGEIEKGIARLERGRRKQLLRDWVDNTLSRRFSGRILSFDCETASRWGRISGEAARKGKPLPVLDGMLAATALINGLTLVTRDTGVLASTGVQIFNPWTGT
jgi:toxin FitB